MRLVSGLLTCLVVLSSCGLIGDSEEREPLQFAQLQIDYAKYGGWINTSKLAIQPTGQAKAELLGHASGEVVAQGTTSLSVEEQERLASLLASFPEYHRTYQPDDYYTDGNTHVIVLNYRGALDTVSVYGPSRGELPQSLWKTIETLERVHDRAIP